MTDQRIEAVARAMCDVDYKDVDAPVTSAHHREWFYDEFIGKPLWQVYREAARAAIEADTAWLIAEAEREAKAAEDAELAHCAAYPTADRTPFGIAFRRSRAEFALNYLRSLTDTGEG